MTNWTLGRNKQRVTYIIVTNIPERDGKIAEELKFQWNSIKDIFDELHKTKENCVRQPGSNNSCSSQLGRHS